MRPVGRAVPGVVERIFADGADIENQRLARPIARLKVELEEFAPCHVEAGRRQYGRHRPPAAVGMRTVTERQPHRRLA
jgi:hypothetical protein